MHCPRATHRRERRERSEGCRHADQQRQRAAREGLFGARQHERQHRQNARTQYGQCTAEKCQYRNDHADSVMRGLSGTPCGVHTLDTVIDPCGSLFIALHDTAAALNAS
jgi:hypothetical protein